MKLKQAPARSELRARLLPWLRARRRRSLLLLQLCLLGLAFGGGMLAYRQKLHRILRSAISANVSMLPHMIEGWLSQPPHLALDVALPDYLRLEAQREAALDQGFLFSEGEDYVPAELRVDGQSIDVRLRLKGDHVDHLEGDKWSFRVQTRGDATVLGMKQLSLHHPRTRAYAYEWLYQRAMAREDVIALRYRFVDLTLNGRHLGIYALEEHFEKRLVEHNRRREGPILRFDESLFWLDELAASRFEGQGRQWNGAGAYFASAVDGFQTGAMLEDPDRVEQYRLAASLLESFRRGERSASEVFDIERTARFFALSDLFGAEHGTRWHNLRFYFNPVTSRLEPLAFDGFETSGWTGWQDSGLPFPATTLSGVHLLDAEAWGHNARLFADPELFAAYYRNLERISRPEWLDALFAELDEDLDAELAVLYREFPYYRFSRDLIYQNAAYVRAALRPEAPIRAFVAASGPDRLTLELGNIQNIPVQVLGVSKAGERITAYGGSVLLPGRRGTAAVDYRSLRLPLALGEDPLPAALAELSVDYRFLGSSESHEAVVTPLPREDADLVRAAGERDQPNPGDFDFLVIDEAARRIDIQPGRWIVDQRMILPAGYTITAQGRVALDLRDGAFILSRSPLRFEGSLEAPILIESSDGSGQGLAVIEPGEASTLRGVRFRNLAAPEQPGWAMTGAVTFYGAPVSLEAVRFEDSRAEDALNILRADVSIVGSRFSGTRSDALDVDFGAGKVSDTRFERVGNDALDLSGSTMVISGIVIEGFGDKGISAGEASRVEGSDIRISDGEIGVASKDLSELRLTGLSLDGLKVGLTCFQKKPEFGPAMLSVDGLQLGQTSAGPTSASGPGVELLWLLEPGSSLSIEGDAKLPNAEALEEIFYGVKFGKASE